MTLSSPQSTVAVDEGRLIVSEVAPWSSGSTFGIDWFEVTNVGSAPVVITGWSVDDDSNLASSSIPLQGITSIEAGESVIFIETSSANLATKAAEFKSRWFGASPPANLQVGNYSGSGIGLSTGGDHLHLFDSTQTRKANVIFGANVATQTFDNSAGLEGGTISLLSQSGVNGAFTSATVAGEIGSPGRLGNVIISEIAPWSSGGTSFGVDWFEVTNTTAQPVTITGWKVDDDSHLFANALELNGITTIKPGESVVFMEVAAPGDFAARATGFKTRWFGGEVPLQLGYYTGSGIGFGTSADAAYLFDSAGVEQTGITFGASPAAPFASFDNSAGRTGAISQLSVVGTNGAFKATNANETGSPGRVYTVPITVVSSPIKINEIESSGGTPGDWVELINTGPDPVDVSGLKLLDNDDTHAVYAIPAATTIPAGGFLVLEEAQFGFGLGSTDSVRLFSVDGTGLVDSHSWLEHSGTSYGRCVNGTGAFISSVSPTKGAANDCPVYNTWPGGSTVTDASTAGMFTSNLSGFMYEPSGTSAPGVLWAVKNGPGTLYHLTWDGSAWVGSGKLLRYENGTGDVDAEGVTYTTSPAAGIYVASERNNASGAVSRTSILRFDPSQPTADLTATHEWNITANLPTVGANLGLEGITWLPDTYLVENGLLDENTEALYDPADYENHAGGLFFVAVEANGFIYAYALDHVTETFTRIATIDSGFPSVMEVHFDRELEQFWAVCDDTCQGRTHLLSIDSSGEFLVTARFERPSGMPNLNNEGFAVAAQLECVENLKPAYWADDGETNGISIRAGTVPCDGGDVTPPVASPSQSPLPNGNGWNKTDVTVTWNWSDDLSGIDPSNCTETTVSSAEGTFDVSASCTDFGGNSTQASWPVKVDKTPPVVTVTGPANGGSYAQGSVPAAGCTTSDPLSGVDVQATLSLSNVGLGPVTATCSGAVDLAGNAAPPVAITYTVTPPPPAMQVTGVSEGGVYTRGQVPGAGCVAIAMGSPITVLPTLSITGGDAQGLGSFTATCAGAKAANGLVAAPVSVMYTVIAPPPTICGVSTYSGNVNLKLNAQQATPVPVIVDILYSGSCAFLGVNLTTFGPSSPTAMATNMTSNWKLPAKTAANSYTIAIQAPNINSGSLFANGALRTMDGSTKMAVKFLSGNRLYFKLTGFVPNGNGNLKTGFEIETPGTGMPASQLVN